MAPLVQVTKYQLVNYYNMNTSLNIFRGDDVTIKVTVKDSDGNAIDITGYTFWLTAKKQEDDTDANAVMQKEVTSHTDEENGKTAIELSNSDTDVDVESYYYDIQMKDDSDKITTLVKGTMNVKQDITSTTT